MTVSVEKRQTRYGNFLSQLAIIVQPRKVNESGLIWNSYDSYAVST